MKDNEYHPPSSPIAFTLIELLVTISIIAVLAAISLPVISNVKESSRSTKCVSNLREIGAAMDLYANDNSNCYPPLGDANTNWDSVAIQPYLPLRQEKGYTRQSSLFICPTAAYKGFVNTDLSRTYSVTDCMLGPGGVYSSGSNRGTFASFSGTLVLFDALPYLTNRYANEIVNWGQVSGATDLKTGTTSTYIDYRHHNAFHGLFADGHVDTITRTAAPTIVTQTMWKGR